MPDSDFSPDLQKPECPYCRAVLTKVPSRKTRCPHCGEFMFVRTRFEDRARVVASKREADQIEEKWTLGGGVKNFREWDKQEFENERAILRKRFHGSEPSDNDVKWGLLNNDLMRCAETGQWGAYRWVLLGMAEVLRGERKLRDALGLYLEVCYFDWNGPNNKPIWSGLDPFHAAALIDTEFAPFIPKRQFFAPYVVDKIRRIAKYLKVDNDQLKHLFLEQATRFEHSLKMPITPSDSWCALEKELGKA